MSRLPPLHIARKVFAVFILCSLAACTTTGSYVADQMGSAEHPPLPDSVSIAHRVFLVGNVGGFEGDSLPPALTRIKRSLPDSSIIGLTTVFLGDNVHCCGLAREGHPDRPEQERQLEILLDFAQEFPGKTYFLPGDRDWDNGGRDGLLAINRQEAFIEDHLGYNAFIPDDGFSGPAAIELTEFFVLVAIDTQWWLHPYTRATGATDDYDINRNLDLVLEIDDLIKEYDDEVLLFVGHHPVVSKGRHAGYMPAEDHLFALRNIHPSLWIPTPIVGSLYPMYTKVIGGPQDLAHPRYRGLRQALSYTFGQRDGIMYASAHEKNLQYLPTQATIANLGRQHYIISGSATHNEPIAKSDDVQFGFGGVGYAVVDVFEDGAAQLEMWAASDDSPRGKLLFRSRLKGPEGELVDTGVPTDVEPVEYADSSVVMAINPDYQTGEVGELLLGSQHRDSWATPVEAPVLDLTSEAGGLTLVKRGGGNQTSSLRFEGSKGTEYVLRSIDKDHDRVLPPYLRSTIAGDLIQDQTSAQHPFGALIIPPLADAVGIYHTNPKIVYVPHDARLGIYKDEFAGRIMLFEERPDDDMSDWPTSGSSEDVESTRTLLEDVEDENDHRVDQRFYAKNRLFDMLVSDWDRHNDQWRWASFEPYELKPYLRGEAREKGKIYRPIPRDRDWAFNRMNGVIPALAEAFFIKDIQDFDASYGYIRGLYENSVALDRRFLNDLELDDWREIAAEMQSDLTDEVIEESVREWPSSIQEIDGDVTIEHLKIRRDKLVEVAEEFYGILAARVDVVGSNQNELFEINRLGEDSTEVVVYDISDEGQAGGDKPRREIYRRIFTPDQTDAVYLFGLDGPDEFVVRGNAESSLDVVAVGGAGDDTFIDNTTRDGGNPTRIYDTAQGTSVSDGPQTALFLSDHFSTRNLYDPSMEGVDVNLPRIEASYDSDDGFIFGGGFQMIRHGLDKRPYAADHAIWMNVGTQTGAYSINYAGHYVDVLGRVDVALDAAYGALNNVRNFFGYGNDTVIEENPSFYKTRVVKGRATPLILGDFRRRITLSAGPSLRYANVSEDDNGFLTTLPGIDQSEFGHRFYAGVLSTLSIETVDNRANPKRGIRWDNDGSVYYNLESSGSSFARFGTDLSLYLTPWISPQITLAARIGGAYTIGDFPFYESATLGGSNNLRGYRSHRFSGHSVFFQNLEARLELFDFNWYLAGGSAGLLAFVDNGRVWSDLDDDSTTERTGFLETYHQGYGGGFWLALFDKTVVQTQLATSPEDTIFSFGVGFQF